MPRQERANHNTHPFRRGHATQIYAFTLGVGRPCLCYLVMSPPLHGLAERCFRQVLCVYVVICLYLQHTGAKHRTPCIRLRCVSVDLLARPPTGGRQLPLQGDDNLLSPEFVIPLYGGAQEVHLNNAMHLDAMLSKGNASQKLESSGRQQKCQHEVV